MTVRNVDKAANKAYAQKPSNPNKRYRRGCVDGLPHHTRVYRLSEGPFVYFEYGGGLIRHLMFFNKGYKCLEGLKLWLEVFPLPYN